MLAVEGEMHAPVAVPSELHGGQRLTLERVDDGKVPGQNVDRKLWRFFAERVQKCEQRRRKAVARSAFRQEGHMGIEIPAHHRDGVPSFDRGLTKGSEVRCAVDEEREAVRARQAPAIATRL